MPDESAIELADAIDDSHSDEWAGAAIADGLTRALRRMALNETQMNILVEELTRTNPDLSFQAPNKSRTHQP
jgi:hypothetical protein